MNWFSDPTIEELYEEAFGISSDVAWYAFRDDAVRQYGSDWEAGYEPWCIETHGYVPIRLHNLGDPNTWSYPPGPACVQSLPALPPYLSHVQIAYLNACVPYEFVAGATAAINKMREAFAAKLPTPHA